MSFFFAPKTSFSQINNSDYFNECILWLKADTGVIVTNDVIESWNDISGQNNNYGINNSSFRPVLYNSYELNNNACVRFDGQNDKIYNASIDSINEYDLSIFIISKGYNQQGVGSRAGFLVLAILVMG